jgi:hypothetical protein
VKSYLQPSLVYDGQGFVLAAQQAPSGWQYAGPALFRLTTEGEAITLPGGFLGESYSLAADSAGKRTLIWSCRQMEHGHGCVVYLASVFPADGSQYNQMAVGLQDTFGPRNGLWCAATFDGKTFVAVVEQTVNHGYSDRGVHVFLDVNLAATRIDPATARLLDTGSMEVPPQAWQDMRPYRQKAVKLSGPSGIPVANEPQVQERHPAMASLGEGKSVVVYSRRGGPGQFKIHAVMLNQ